MSSRQRIYVLAGVLTVALAVVVVAIALGGGSKTAKTEPTVTTKPASYLAGVPQNGDRLGRADAAATLYVFEDPQCPYCRDWSIATLPGVVGTFVKTGRVKIVWEGIPIVGENSLKGLTAAYAAGNQNRLWNFIDQLYQRQGAENSGWIDEATLRDSACAAGVDADRMLKDAKTSAVDAKITGSESNANTYSIRGTPSFVVVKPPAAAKVLPLTSLDATVFNTALATALGQ
jgi:protein-disulfide isomerase